MKRKAWIVVANSDCARLLKVESVGVLKELDRVVASHATSEQQDRVHDRPSRTSHTTGTQGHALEFKLTPHQKEMEEFAKKLVHHLDQAHQKGEFENLYLVAEPRLMGYLHKAMPHHMASFVAGEVTKDLVFEDLKHMWSHLPFAV